MRLLVILSFVLPVRSQDLFSVLLNLVDVVLRRVIGQIIPSVNLAENTDMQIGSLSLPDMRIPGLSNGMGNIQDFMCPRCLPIDPAVLTGAWFVVSLAQFFRPVRQKLRLARLNRLSPPLRGGPGKNQTH